MPRISFFAGLLVLLLGTPCVLADWLILNDGIQVHGTIIRRTQREVVLRSKDGAVLTFDLKKIADVHGGPRGYKFLDRKELGLSTSR